MSCSSAASGSADGCSRSASARHTRSSAKPSPQGGGPVTAMTCLCAWSEIRPCGSPHVGQAVLLSVAGTSHKLSRLHGRAS